METQASAKAGLSGRKILIAVGAPVLVVVAYVAVKALMGPGTPPRPKTDAMIVGQTRTAFVKSFNDTCLKRQRTASVNASVPDAKLTAYCGCWSDAVAGETTNFEVQFSAGILSQAQIDRNERLAKACLAKI